MATTLQKGITFYPPKSEVEKRTAVLLPAWTQPLHANFRQYLKNATFRNEFVRVSFMVYHLQPYQTETNSWLQ